MKDVKVYNLIFPIWLLIFFPPVVFITLLGNFLIDSLVIIICFYLFKLSKSQPNLKAFYQKSIMKVWLFGFLADIIGAVILMMICGLEGENFGLSYELTSAISYDPFSHPLAVFIISIAMLISTICIFFFNYKYTFKNIITDKKARRKVALTIAIITIPWTFLLPTQWFF
ncbi:hypothetical protein [Bacillus sp. FJAT-42315]|uniref:hypothetical protein n=1 Tax=Bacillus sp. FJAT-42315 TaxID=2014077 RepID=UPI000BA91773|nr:hypothetical protein [Bacillus sp. FJAT-42315]PAQ15727.1 hypothetical protein CD798_05160 [Bacillaceae bacterium SAOS 7]